MQYDNYESKIHKIEKFFKLVFRHLPKIIVSFAIIIATTVTLLATRGIVTAEAEGYPTEIVYGENFEYSAKAFLSKTEYEYCPAGTEEWTKEVPSEAGTYNVRAVAKATFGYKYGPVETFTIQAKPTEVRIASTEVPYGDEPEVSAELEYEDHISAVTFSYDENRTVAKVASVTISNAEGEDVTSSYNLIFISSPITTIARPITVDIADATKIYDGTPLTSSEYVISENTLVEGDRLEVGFDVSLLNVGEVENTATYKIYDKDGNDVSQHYDISTNVGKLTVLPRELSVTTADMMGVIYDAEAHQLKEYAITGETSLAEGHSSVAENWAQIVNVGTVENSIGDFKIFDADGQDVSANYTVTFVWGKLNVDKRKVTVATATSDRIYDGSAFSDTSHDVSNTSHDAPGLVDGHTTVVKESASLTDVGSVENRITVDIMDGDVCVTDNYDITYSYGILTVNKRPITVTSLDCELIYNGEDQSIPEDYIKIDNIADTDSLGFIAVIPGAKNVGEYISEVTVQIVRGVQDVTQNYEITYQYGTLKISKRTLNVKTESAEFVYDGLAHTYGEFSYSNIVDGHRFNALSNTSITYVTEGTVENKITEYVIFDSKGEDVTANYDVVFEYGTLTVLKRTIGFSTASAEKIYDGTPLTAPEWLVIDNSLAEGDEIFANAPEGSQTNVGSINNTYSGELRIYRDGVDVTENYDILPIEIGTLTVYPRPIMVKTEDASFVYDGKYHSALNLVAMELEGYYGLCEGHEFSATTYFEFCNVSDSGANVVACEIMCDGEIVTGNYIVEYTYGNVDILPRSIVISTNVCDKVYDGKDFYDDTIHCDAFDEIKGTGLCEGHEIKVLYAPTFRDVIENAENVVEFIIVCGDEEIDPNNYDITNNWGSVNITKRPITVSSGSLTVVYDAQYHSNWDIFATPYGENMGLCEGHIIEALSAPAFINVIENADNELDFRIITEYGEEIDLNNYDITYDWGKVNITKRPITIYTNSYEGVYDGQDHSVHFAEELTVGGMGLCDGQWIYIIPETITEIKNVWEGKNALEVGIYDNFGDDVTDNYEITYEYGNVKVTKRAITVSTNSYEGVYDGEDHAVYYPDALIVGGMGLCDGHYFDPTSYTEIKNVVSGGINEIKFNIVDEYGEEIDLNNYDITYDWGTINISKRVVKIETASESWEYDGKPHTNTKYDTLDGTSFIPGHIVKTKNGSQTYITAEGSVENSFELVVFDEEMNDLKDNYDIQIVNRGTLTVEPKKEGGGGSGDGDGGGDGPGGSGGDGPGGSGGDGAGILNISGNIGASDEESENWNTPIFLVTSDHSGKLYLKVKSFGDYNGAGWNDAEEYGSLILDYASAQYLTAFALQNYGEPTHYVKILSLYGEYILPYYSTTDDCDIQISDTYIVGNAADEYMLCYFAWDYESGVTVPEALADFEARYYEFVIDNYLDIDEETKAFLQGIIDEQGFDPNDPLIIEKVAKYIQNAATYNFDYDRSLDNSNNVVVDFLANYKEGICQHYASSATMLFRALGIPARYTIGYTTSAEADIETEITGKQAHAWVEVYIKGLGWINVEVTGGGSGEGGEGGGSGEGEGGEGEGGEGEGGDMQKETIVVMPQHQWKEYDGTPLIAENLIETYNDPVLRRLLEQGYTYNVEIVGSQLFIGSSISTVASFELYDPNGVNVTSLYNIKYREGTLEVLGPTIKIYIYHKEREYTSKTFTYSNKEYLVISAPKGVVLDISEINISITDVGVITSAMINSSIHEYLSYTAYDSVNGVDITDGVNIVVVNYGDEANYDVIKVTPRRFVITTESASKNYDGQPLTQHKFYVSKGLLPEGHKIYLKITGEQTAKGESPNTFFTGGWESYKHGSKNTWYVLDENGNDVTHNYEMEEYILGTLTVY